MPRALKLKTSSHKSISNSICAERLINLTCLSRPDSDYSPLTIVNTMGSTAFTTESGVTEGRGGCVDEDDIAYVVWDNDFFTVTSGGTRTDRGDLEDATGVCKVIDGKTYVLILDMTAGKAYTYNKSSTAFAKITDAQFTALTGMQGGGYLNGFFYVVFSYTIAASELDDPTNWVADRQNTVYTKMLGFAAANNQVVIPGANYTTFYVAPQNPTTNFPISRQAVRGIGFIGNKSFVILNDVMYGIGKPQKGKAGFYKSTFADIQKVNIPDFNVILEDTATLSDAEGMGWVDRDMEFYCLRLPTANKTYLVNITLGVLSELQLSNGNLLPWREYLNQNRKHLCLDAGSGIIYELRHTLYQYNGGDAPRTAILPTLWDSDRMVKNPRVRVAIDASTYATAQTWTMSASLDGGENYNTALTDSVTSTTNYAQYEFSAGNRITPKLQYTGNNRVIINNITHTPTLSEKESQDGSA